MRKPLLTLVASVGIATIFALPAQAAEAKPPAKEPKKYVVVAGDSLSKIAEEQKLESWRPIWNVNTELADPDLINPGQELIIPEGPTTDRPVPVEAVQPAPRAAATATQSRPAAARKATANYAAGSGGLFASIRQKESGGNYATNTGNGYYGAYQFDLATWRSNAPAGYQNTRPDLAPPSVQDQAAANLYARRGCSPWPNTCG